MNAPFNLTTARVLLLSGGMLTATFASGQVFPGSPPGGPNAVVVDNPIIPPTDQRVTRTDLNGVASSVSTLTHLAAFSNLNAFRTDVTAKLAIANTRLVTAQADLNVATSTGNGVAKATTDFNYANQVVADLTAVQAQLAAARATALNTATTQTAAGAAVTGIVANYSAGVATQPNLESILNGANALPSSATVGFVPAQATAANGASVVPGATPGTITLTTDFDANGNYKYLANVTAAATALNTAYTGFGIGVSDAQKTQIVRDIANGSWERQAILDTHNAITDGSQSLSARGLTVAPGTASGAGLMVGSTLIHAEGNTLHFGPNSLVFSDSRGGTDMDTISTSSGDLRFQNGAVTISQAGVLTTAGGASFGGPVNVTGNFAVSGGASFGGPVTIGGVTAATVADVASERTRAVGVETALGTAIVAETTRATAAENTLDTKINTETTRAIGAETTLRTAITTETSRAMAAESTLDTKINTETSRAIGVETALSTQISAETVRALTAESVLDTKINTETTRATAAETVLDNKINAETTRATTRENFLDTKINTETSRAIAAEAQVLRSANAYTDSRIKKVQNSIAAVAALQTPQINAGDKNAVRFTAAGVDGGAGLSFGYARRLNKGLTADVSAAADAEFKSTAVRGGLNFSF